MRYPRHILMATLILLLTTASFAAPAPDTPVTPADRSAVAEVAVGRTDANAPLTPDPEPKPPHPVVGRPILMPGGTEEFFEKDDAILFAPADVAIAAVCHELKGSITVERFDLTAGRSLNSVKMPTRIKGMDLSADGKRLLSHTVGEGFGHSDRVDVTAIDTATPHTILSFVPFDNAQDGPGRDVAWAHFTADGHILTLSLDGHLAAWDDHAKAVWSATLPRFDRIAVSAGRKYLALAADDNTIAVLDAADGKTLATFTAPPTGGGVNKLHGVSLAFSPDGKQLAASAQNILFVYDLTTGKQADELYPAIPGEPGLTFVGDGYLLAAGGIHGESYLVSLEKKIVVWQYQRARFHRTEQGVYDFGRYWYTAKPQPPAKGKPALVGVVMPDAKVLAAIAKAPPPEMIIHPGISVSLQLDVPDDIKPAVADALKSALQKNGVTVAAPDNQPIKLVASTAQGQSKEINYVPSMLVAAPGTPEQKHATKVTANELITKLAFIGPDGKTIWERQETRQPPTSLRLKNGQSIPDAVKEAMKPTADFFKDTNLPKLLPKSSDAKGFGKSTLTMQGAVAIP